MERLLTKSLFVRALECPCKILYAGKSSKYADNSLDNEFLNSLAEGGIQVGALARCYFPEGIPVDELDRKVALQQTAELLKQDQVTIFEAAIQSGNCFIRADILVKNGDTFNLIEVKAKSYDQSSEDGFLKKRTAEVSREWQPYVYDVAFQKLVLQRAYPDSTIHSHLMLADKRCTASVDGLNQKFVLQEKDGRISVCHQGDCSPASLGQSILVQVPVDEAVSLVSEGQHKETGNRSLAEYVDWLSEHYRDDRKAIFSVGVQCQSCEFKASPEQLQNGLASGFYECWHKQWGLSPEELQQPNVFDIWNFRGKEALIKQRRFFLKDVTRDDITGGTKPKKNPVPGLSVCDRQWLQVDKSQRGDTGTYFDKDGFSMEMNTWRYPLHFIDFETSAVAIPFDKGRHPYEGIAFQFSHHIAYEDGRIEHAGEYLNAKPGVFPNFDFVRELKRQLESDDGTIFRYAAHENTYLNMIFNQLQDETPDAVPDRDELISWIMTITKSTKDSSTQWEGERNMVDMCELVKRYYFSPYTNGSNSIKWVLPAVLNSSEYIQKKYSQPIYGAQNGIRSLNYNDWVWVKRAEDGSVIDPYHLLPSVMPDMTSEQIAQAEESNSSLANGAAAMTAYARLQFMQMPDQERKSLESAFLRYCELDTMAMVLIWESWMNLSFQH